MDSDASKLSALDLKAAFDASFALPHQTAEEKRSAHILLRTGTTFAALRLAEVLMVVPRPVLTSLPSESSALKGLAAVRGTLVAVYDLGALLHARGTGFGKLVCVSAADKSAAFMFDELLGSVSVAEAQIRTRADGSVGGNEALLELNGVRYSVVSMQVMLDKVRQGRGLERKLE